MTTRTLLIWLILLVACQSPGFTQATDTRQAAPSVSIVTDKSPGVPVSYGLRKLTDMLRQKKISFEMINSLSRARGRSILVAGLSSGEGEAARLLKTDETSVDPGRHSIDTTPEALVIWKTRQKTTLQKSMLQNTGSQKKAGYREPVWVVNGFDDQGLLYALLDVTTRVGWSNDRNFPWKEVREIREKPFVAERAISVYTMNRAYWESRFYDEAYWNSYLDMLAEDRFNSLIIIFGYENGGFLAPCYPYFFNVEGFPGVRMTGLSPAQQQHNLLAMNRLIRMAHERGIKVTLGIWDHIYRGGVQGGGIPGNDTAPDHPVSGLVWGVTGDNLTSYTRAALAALIKQMPGVDGIQFRMHDESGLKKGEQVSFWTDVFGMIKQAKPGLRLDLRAKELPQPVIRAALNTGIRFRISTKYWMEQMGMPFHPTRINPDKSARRHSYSDLLHYPKEYAMHWQLWSGGTSRVLLWGDPDYVRRFAESARLYEGDGYEVNEPLATKMEAQPHDAKPFDLLQSPHRYYTWEFQRYWHFFQVFGRIGYDTATPADNWVQAFGKHFGSKTGPLVEEALHRASWILPRIVATCYPYSYFPTTRGWAEKQRLGDLPEYAKAEGGDLCQFETFDEEAQLLLDGGETAKLRPAVNSQWFEQTAAAILGLTDSIKSMAAGNPAAFMKREGKELGSTVTDLEILAYLAHYHARRIPAAVSYRLFERTHDPAMLDSAIVHEREAIEAWRQIVRSAGDYYSYDLMMGVRVADLCGHWKDELAKLEQGVQRLETARQAADPGSRIRLSPSYNRSPGLSFDRLFEVSDHTVHSIAAGTPVPIRLTIVAPAGIKWVRLCYRAVNQELSYQSLPMTPTANAGEYEATIPSGQADPTWDLMYYVELMDKDGNGRIFPDFNKETPYKIIKLIR